MYLSCLNEDKRALILDASVIINLNATGMAQQILTALPNPVFVTDIAVSEIKIDSKHGRKDHEHLEILICTGTLKTISLENLEESIFSSLVLTLDDGEAATIAASSQYNGVAVVDERKARRTCREQFPNISQASTIDILSHQNVDFTLGKNAVSEAVYGALVYARMRVLEEQIDWVKTLIGQDKLRECHSLPKTSRVL